MFIAKKIKNYPLSSLLVVAIWVVCLIPVPETPLNDVCFIDKWTHFVMYGSLTTVIWFEYLWKKRPLTRHCVTPSPQGARGEVCNGPLTKNNEQEMVTSSSPLGERMPKGQVRGLMGKGCPQGRKGVMLCLSAVSYALSLWAVSSSLHRLISLPVALVISLISYATPSEYC